MWVCTYRKVAAKAAEPTEELVALTDNNLVHTDVTIVTQLEREVGILRVVEPAVIFVSLIPSEGICCYSPGGVGFHFVWPSRGVALVRRVE